MGLHKFLHLQFDYKKYQVQYLINKILVKKMIMHQYKDIHLENLLCHLVSFLFDKIKNSIRVQDSIL